MASASLKSRYYAARPLIVHFGCGRRCVKLSLITAALVIAARIRRVAFGNGGEPNAATSRQARALAVASLILWVLCLALAGLNALFFQTRLRQGAVALQPGVDTPIVFKVVGGVSLLAWLGVLYFGRLMPFWGASISAGL